MTNKTLTQLSFLFGNNKLNSCVSFKHKNNQEYSYKNRVYKLLISFPCRISSWLRISSTNEWLVGDNTNKRRNNLSDGIYLLKALNTNTYEIFTHSFVVKR
jgi:hypothetical protein